MVRPSSDLAAKACPTEVAIGSRFRRVAHRPNSDRAYCKLKIEMRSLQKKMQRKHTEKEWNANYAAHIFFFVLR